VSQCTAAAHAAVVAVAVPGLAGDAQLAAVFVKF